MPWLWKDGRPVAWVDPDPAEQPEPAQPRDNFVERFLAGPVHVSPSLPTRHGPGGRFYHRKSRRRD